MGERPPPGEGDPPVMLRATVLPVPARRPTERGRLARLVMRLGRHDPVEVERRFVRAAEAEAAVMERPPGTVADFFREWSAGGERRP